MRDVVERARLLELLDRGRACPHRLGLVLGALHREPEVCHLLADAVGGLRDPDLGLGGGVLRLDDLLLGPELLDLLAQTLLVGDQRLLLRLQLLDLLVERLQLGLSEVLALERRAREVLATLRERLPGLRVELHDLLLELRGLHLKALLRRDDVGDALLDVLKQLGLLLVAVVERLARVLGPVEHPRDLRLHNRRHASCKPWHVSSSSRTRSVGPRVVSAPSWSHARPQHRARSSAAGWGSRTQTTPATCTAG